MSRSVDKRLSNLLDCAEAAGSCLAATTPADRRALQRRLNSPNSTLFSPVRGLFVRRDTWRGLTPPQKSLHIMRGLSKMHPGIVFCGVSAALVWGLNVSWRWTEFVHVAHATGSWCRSHNGVVCHQVDEKPVEVDGLLVTSIPRCVLDCLSELPFADGLAVADAALRRLRISRKRLAATIRDRYFHTPGIRRALAVLDWAEPAAESGGESIARAQIIRLGYELPKLQVTFPRPLDERRSYRVDFCWDLPSGGQVFGELDGTEKYAGDTIRALSDERLRESRLTSLGAGIMRFSFSDATNPRRMRELLELYGVPQTGCPTIAHGDIPVCPAAYARRTTVFAQGTMVLCGMTTDFMSLAA